MHAEIDKHLFSCLKKAHAEVDILAKQVKRLEYVEEKYSKDLECAREKQSLTEESIVRQPASISSSPYARC